MRRIYLKFNDYSLTYKFENNQITENFYSYEETLLGKVFESDETKIVTIEIFREALLKARISRFCAKINTWVNTHYPNSYNWDYSFVFKQMNEVGYRFNKTLAALVLAQIDAKEQSANEHMAQRNAVKLFIKEQADVIITEGLIQSYELCFSKYDHHITVIGVFGKVNLTCYDWTDLRYDVLKRINEYNKQIEITNQHNNKRNELIKQGYYCVVDGVNFKCENKVLNVPDYAMGHLIGSGGCKIKDAQKEFGYFKLNKIITGLTPRKVKAQWL